MPSSTPISSPMAPCIYTPYSPQDTLTLHLATGPQFGSRLANWISQAYCIHAVRLGFPLGRTAVHRCCSEGLRSGSWPAHRSRSHRVLQQWGMAIPPSIVMRADRLPLCHIYLLSYPYHLGRVRQPTVARSIEDTVWYLCHLYTIDIKDALASLTIEGPPGSTHLQSTACLKAALATQIKSTTRLKTHYVHFTGTGKGHQSAQFPYLQKVKPHAAWPGTSRLPPHRDDSIIRIPICNMVYALPDSMKS